MSLAHSCSALTLSLAAAALLAAPARTAPLAQGGPYVQLKANTPGTAQTGHLNISGTAIAGTFKGNGAQVTNLAANNVSSGKLADARLSNNVALLAAVQTITGLKTFAAAPAFTAAGAPFTVASAIRVVNLNADRLDGLDSSAFLQSVPMPLQLYGSIGAGPMLDAQNFSSGGTGVLAYGDYVGVHSYSSSTAIWGEGSNGGNGVVGWSDIGSGVSGSALQTGIGVAGTCFGAGHGYGVFGESNSATGAGVWGKDYSTAPGVHAESMGGNGLEAVGALNGVQAYSSNAGASGVYGENLGGGYGVAGRMSGSGGGAGVYGEAATGWAMYSKGNMLVEGNLIVTGSKTGFVVDLVRNGDVVALQVGDVVEIAGFEEPVLGEIPVIVVRRASATNAEAVLGPIASAIEVTQSEAHEPRSSATAIAGAPRSSPAVRAVAGPIAPGAFANVVTLGAFKTIKVDASFGAIQPGTRLVASPNPGYAQAAFRPEAGTIVGKSLGSLFAGTGEVPVLVAQQ